MEERRLSGRGTLFSRNNTLGFTFGRHFTRHFVETPHHRKSFRTLSSPRITVMSDEPDKTSPDSEFRITLPPFLHHLKISKVKCEAKGIYS